MDHLQGLLDAPAHFGRQAAGKDWWQDAGQQIAPILWFPFTSLVTEYGLARALGWTWGTLGTLNQGCYLAFAQMIRRGLACLCRAPRQGRHPAKSPKSPKSTQLRQAVGD
jgi:hypothetical protein